MSNHEEAEIRRSAIEALRCTGPLTPNPDQLVRYSNPPEDTAFSLEYCFHLLGDLRGKEVLDYGCGAGKNTLLLASLGARVVAVDLSPDLLKIAKERLRISNLKAEFHAASCYDTGLPPCSVDILFCINVLHHLETERARAEILRVLKPGGVLFFTVPFLWPLHDVPHDEYRFTPFALRRHLSNAGFGSIEIRAMGGWDASLSQMIGLWVRRRPMGKRTRWILSHLSVPVVKFFHRRDQPPVTFERNTMLTGIGGTAMKPG